MDIKPFYVPRSFNQNPIYDVALEPWTTAGRPGTPVTGQIGYNTTLNVPEFYGGDAAGFYQLASKAAAVAENELIVSEAIATNQHSIKAWGGAAGFVKVDASAIVSTVSTINIDDILAGDIESATTGDTVGEQLGLQGQVDHWVTAKAAKEYIDANITAQDLDITDGTTSIAIDLDSEVLSLLGTTNQITATASGNTVTFSLPSNIIVPSQITLSQTINEFSTDVTLGGNSDLALVTEKAIKTYVDNQVALNIRYRDTCELSLNSASVSLPADTSTQIDGVTVTDGMRILVIDSLTAGEDHKIYLATVAGTAISYAVQQDGTGADLPTEGDTVWVGQGTARGDTRWTYNGSQWIQTAGTGTYTATTPITITGSVISHDNTNGYKHVPSDGAANQVLEYASAGTASWSLIDNANISASAAIAWTKLAAGTANYVMITSATGYPTTEQYLDVTRGGTGIGSITDHALIVGSGTADVTVIALPAANNRILFGKSAADPAWSPYAMPATMAEHQILYGDSTTAVKVDSSFTFNDATNTLAIGETGVSGIVKIFGANGYISFQVDTGAANEAYTWPTAAIAGGYLKTDASGNLSWDTTAGDLNGTKELTFTGTVAAGGWLDETDQYSITLLNSGATGNGQQNHGLGTDTKWQISVYEYISATEYRRRDDAVIVSIGTGTSAGQVKIITGEIFQGKINLISMDT